MRKALAGDRVAADLGLLLGLVPEELVVLVCHLKDSWGVLVLHAGNRAHGVEVPVVLVHHVPPAIHERSRDPSRVGDVAARPEEVGATLGNTLKN